MRISFIAAEFAPLAQSGGLGDAVSGLARELAARGHSLHCLLPGYRDLLQHPRCPALAPVQDVELALPERALGGRWLAGEFQPGVTLEVLELPELYDRPGLYGDREGLFVDLALRFVALCRAAALRVATLRPDLLVAHDWHAALCHGLLRVLEPGGGATGTVQVVHNNAYQGVFDKETMRRAGLPEQLLDSEDLEFHGEISMLKGGLTQADRIVAVSANYARELEGETFGMGLEGVYRGRRARLCGITNGIDVERFDPFRDPALPAPFGLASPDGKRQCRKALLEELDLDEPPAGRLCVAIGRFDWQKGWDILAEALDDLVERGATVALLGEGDGAIAASLHDASRRHPGRIRTTLGWREALARRLYGGGDCVLIPSRFEPCGLVQLLGQRYGTLPVAHRVGGLADTIRDGESGILFDEASAAALVEAVDRAAALFSDQGAEAVLRRLLSLDVSWAGPAARWEQLLEETGRGA